MTDITERAETPEALIDSYFRAWNAHDSAALSRAFAPDGTYEDPTTGGKVTGTAIAGVAERLFEALPDLAFERAEAIGSGSRRVVEWLMRGHNRGTLRAGIEPTGQAVTLAGVDVFDVDPRGIRSVRGYFDQKAFVEGLGLMALVQPIEQGRARYGYSMRVPSGNPKPPGVIALTWIQGANEDEKERPRPLANERPGLHGRARLHLDRHRVHRAARLHRDRVGRRGLDEARAVRAPRRRHEGALRRGLRGVGVDQRVAADAHQPDLGAMPIVRLARGRLERSPRLRQVPRATAGAPGVLVSPAQGEEAP